MESIGLNNLLSKKEYKNIRKKIDNLINDPLNYIGIIFLLFIIYLYFTGEFVYQVISIGYPMYLIQSSIDNNNTTTLLKYFFIYGQMQIINSMCFMLSMPMFYQIKLPIMIFIMYNIDKKNKLIDLLYDKLLLINKKTFEQVKKLSN